MAKAKEKRRSAGARKGGVKVGASKTQKKNDHEFSPTPDHRLHRHRAALLAIFLALVVILFVTPVMYPNQSRMGKFSNNESIHINATDAHLDRVRDFLDTFVCQYKPTLKDDDLSLVDVPGYCHPKLRASPHNRTQMVSKSNTRTTNTSLFSLKHTLHWWTRQAFQSSSDGISGGEHIMTLPRPLQIWDLDALRDEFIRQHFLGLPSLQYTSQVALHKESANPLDSGAYLAVYLLRLLNGSQMGQESSNNQCDSDTESCESEDVAQTVKWSDITQHSQRINLLRNYLSMLPTYDDRIPHSGFKNIHEHPITWTRNMLESLFPKYTHTYNLIVSYKIMVQSEYDALKSASPNEFGSNVNFTQYLGMRVNVLSRAFSAMVSRDDVGPSWNGMDSQSISDEIMSYTTSNFARTSSGIQASDEFKFRSMCPLLDMYNSHPNPNVIWKYDAATSSYLIHATSDGIPSSNEIIVSYGQYTEGHLFSKYGYVNGDGSSKTEISLNGFHRILGNVGLSWQYSPLPFHVWDWQSNATTQGTSHYTEQTLDIQSKELLRYLIFDDGHTDCIDFKDSSSLSTHQELKLLKFLHMKRLANIRRAWMVRLPARNPNARPLQGDSHLDSRSRRDESRVGIDAKNILSICRLLSLTVDDIGGDAIKYLRDGLLNGYYQSSSKHSYFQVDKHEDLLEYRALLCVVRLSDVLFRRYGKYAQSRVNVEPEDTNSREWTAWYIIEGEIRLLSILRSTAANEANKIKNHKWLPENILMRDSPCPIESSLPLLQLEANARYSDTSTSQKEW